MYLPLRDLSQLCVLFLQLGLLAAQVVVQNDLFLQVVEHQVAHTVSVLDLIRESLVTRLELVKNVRIHVQIILAKDIFTSCRILRLILQVSLLKTHKHLLPSSGSRAS